MENEWRERLVDAIKQDGRSHRALSIAAGLGENYIFQMLDRGTAPTMGALVALCETLKVSPLHILTGLPATPQVDELLSLAGQMNPQQLEALLALVRQMSPN